MKPWILIRQDRTPDGKEIAVYQRDKEYSLRVDGKVLMGSRSQGSELLLAERALTPLQDPALEPPHVLIAGLGFGYTLSKALEILPATARVVVVELMQFVIDLNRVELADLAGNALADPRVSALQVDVVKHLKRTQDVYDAILLDVDNGPQAFSNDGNAWLYRQPGLVQIYKRLRPGGVLAVWSVAQDEIFTGQLRASGYQVDCQFVRARDNNKGEKHWLWIATRS